jgi:Bacterial pre-peptidase C-terminal domain
MNSRRQSLILAAAIAVVLLAAAPADAQSPRAVREIKSNVPIMSVVGQAKWEALRSLHKGGAQTFSPSQTQDCVNGNPQVVAFSCGSTTTGQLTSADCFLQDNSYYDAYSFSGTAGQQVTITMSSTAIDAYLFLLDPSGSTAVAQDDDSGGGPSGTDARIVFTLTQTGTWFIVTNAYNPNTFGAYSLSLTCTTAGGGGSCTPNATTLCLNNGRYRVTVTFSSTGPPAQSGDGMAVPETADTGLFWFFSASNIEIIIKVVTGCSFNNRIWVFSGGLTNVAYTITVVDTVTGATKTYSNPQGTPSQPIQDTGAFVCS